MLTESQRNQLIAGTQTWGLNLSPHMVASFARFAALLHEGNQKQNLTRVPPDEVVSRHYLDSLSVASVVRPEPAWKVLDVGTGAGFPGIPLSIVYPDLHMTLLDSTRKRLLFLDEVIAALSLEKTRTHHGRAEDLARIPLHCSGYDLVLARAVAPMHILVQWMLPLVRKDGFAVAYKSHAIDEELLQAEPIIRQLGGRLETIETVVIPFTDVSRKLVILRKEHDREVRRSTRRKI